MVLVVFEPKQKKLAGRELNLPLHDPLHIRHVVNLKHFHDVMEENTLFKSDLCQLTNIINIYKSGPTIKNM